MKLRLFVNLITLAVTSFLLIFVILAWYVTNDEVTATGVIGASAEGNNLYMSSTFIPSENQTTITVLNPNDWKMDLNINTNSLLLPVSTTDAKNFYYTPDVDTDGSAVIKDGKYNFLKVTTSKSYYYLEKEIYLCLADAKDVNCCLKNIVINQGVDEDSNIYKAVRVYFEDSDDSNNNQMFKYEDTLLPVYPAVSTTSVSGTDPAIVSGTQSPDKFHFGLTGSVSDGITTTYTFKKIIIRIWVEGQDENALATYAGTGFSIHLVFATYD